MGQVYEDVHLMWANEIGVDDQKALYGKGLVSVLYNSMALLLTWPRLPTDGQIINGSCSTDPARE